jgi:hypothetical protein
MWLAGNLWHRCSENATMTLYGYKHHEKCCNNATIAKKKYYMGGRYMLQ